MASSTPLSIFTITQLELGSPLIWEPALGTAEHERLIDAYIPGPASIQQKRATIALDFFDTAAASTMPAPFCRTYLVAATPYSPIITPSASISTPSSSFSAASSTSLSSKSSKRSLSSLSSTASSAAPAKRLPGFSIMTKDGVDITNNQSRGPKTKAQREQAAKMRKLGACPACKRSKQKCEPSHHRPTPMSASSSSTNMSSASSSPWQSSSASVSTSPGSRASISPPTSFGPSFSPAAPKRQTPAVHATSNLSVPLTKESTTGDWGFTADQPLAQYCNAPYSMYDFADINDSFDDDLAFAPGLEVTEDLTWLTQEPAFEHGPWYDDFVLSSYFNGDGSHEKLPSAQSSSSESPALASANVNLSHVPGAPEQNRILRWQVVDSGVGSQEDSQLDYKKPRLDDSMVGFAGTAAWDADQDHLSTNLSTVYSGREQAAATLQRQKHGTEDNDHGALVDTCPYGDGLGESENPYTPIKRWKLLHTHFHKANSSSTSSQHTQPRIPQQEATDQDEIFHRKRDWQRHVNSSFPNGTSTSGLISLDICANDRRTSLHMQSSNPDLATSSILDLRAMEHGTRRTRRKPSPILATLLSRRSSRAVLDTGSHSVKDISASASAFASAPSCPVSHNPFSTPIRDPRSVYECAMCRHKHNRVLATTANSTISKTTTTTATTAASTQAGAVAQRISQPPSSSEKAQYESPPGNAECCTTSYKGFL